MSDDRLIWGIVFAYAGMIISAVIIITVAVGG